MLRKLFLTLFSFLSALLIFGQCATVIPNEFLEYRIENNNQQKELVSYNLNKTLSVKVYRVASSLDVYDIAIGDYGPVWDELNEVFDKIGLQFDLCIEEDIPNYNYNILDLKVDTATGLNKYDEMVALHYTPNVINVYYVEEIKNFPDGGNPSGFAFMPGGADVIVLTKGSGPTTAIHEMGHFLGLFHTFETGNELVDGSNCETAGDMICDTPADIDGNTTNCQYNDQQKDANGDYYTPYLSNYMSYYGSCTCRFTNGQYNMMAMVFLEQRNYLW